MAVGLFHSLFGKKKEQKEKRIPKDYLEASIAAGGSSDEEVYVLKGEDWQKILQGCTDQNLSLLYSSGSEEEGSYEYTFRTERPLSEEEKKKLSGTAEKQSGAVRLIVLSDSTFKILYIPA